MQRGVPAPVDVVVDDPEPAGRDSGGAVTVTVVGAGVGAAGAPQPALNTPSATPSTRCHRTAASPQDRLTHRAATGPELCAARPTLTGCPPRGCWCWGSCAATAACTATAWARTCCRGARASGRTSSGGSIYHALRQATRGRFPARPRRRSRAHRLRAHRAGRGRVPPAAARRPAPAPAPTGPDRGRTRAAARADPARGAGTVARAVDDLGAATGEGPGPARRVDRPAPRAGAVRAVGGDAAAGGAAWTRRLIARLDDGAYPMAGEPGSPGRPGSWSVP